MLETLLVGVKRRNRNEREILKTFEISNYEETCDEMIQVRWHGKIQNGSAPAVVAVPPARRLRSKPSVSNRLQPSRQNARRATRRCETKRPGWDRASVIEDPEAAHFLQHNGNALAFSWKEVMPISQL